MHLEFFDRVEDDVDCPWQKSALGRRSLHGVSLPGAGDAVGEEKTVLLVEQIAHQWQADLEHKTTLIVLHQQTEKQK